MARTEEERLREKTVERQFLYERERDFELAPATSRAVLEAVKQALLPSAGILVHRFKSALPNPQLQ